VAIREPFPELDEMRAVVEAFDVKTTIV